MEKLLPYLPLLEALEPRSLDKAKLLASEGKTPEAFEEAKAVLDDFVKRGRKPTATDYKRTMKVHNL